jgi:chemotaxis protein methyltransferase CheR
VTGGGSKQPPVHPAAAPLPRLAPGEVDALLDHLFVRTGQDFRAYARRSLERRLLHVMLHEGAPSVAALRARLDTPAAARLLAERLCVNVTSMFRDPPFWRALRELVVPRLREEPLARVWVAGCATGEEAYAMAILLREEGLLHRSRVYATDVDEAALSRAREGTYPLEQMREFTANYQRAGGTAAFSDHYAAGPRGAMLREAVRRRVLFARHDLVSDAPFNEFHLVLCRNVLIYFRPPLQERACAVFRHSLAPGGVLGTGLHEVLPQALPRSWFEELDGAHKLYRRCS